MQERSRDLGPEDSALFLLLSDMNAERVLAELSSHDGELLRTSASHGDEGVLRDALGGTYVGRAA